MNAGIPHQPVPPGGGYPGAGSRPGTLHRAGRWLGDAVLDLVVPKRCGLCGRFDTFLCPACRAALPRALPPRCPTCWGQTDTRGGCRACAAVLVHSLAGVRSAYRMENGARQLVHALKYNGLTALSGPMGGLLAETLAGWQVQLEVIVPVPLHPARERRRGYNQAALLAGSLSEVSGIPMEAGLLRRTRATTPQVRTVGITARRDNVAGAFAAAGVLRGRSILLLDDVCTTAATLRAAADALRAAGATRVYGLTFAHG